MFLTFEQAVEILDGLVEEKGEDYVYTTDPKTAATKAVYEKNAATHSVNGCYYNHIDGTPGCILGHLIHKLNPEFDLSTGNTEGTEDVIAAADIQVMDGTMCLLLSVQANQDLGYSWGEAVRMGKTEHAA